MEKRKESKVIVRLLFYSNRTNSIRMFGYLILLISSNFSISYSFYPFQSRKNFEMSYSLDEISIGFMLEKVNIVSIIPCIKNTQRGATIHTRRNWYQTLFLFSLLTSELFNVLRQSVGRAPSLVCHPRRRHIVLFPVDPLQRVGWRRRREEEEVVEEVKR